MFDGEAIPGANEQKRTRTRKRTIHFGVGDMQLRPGELARFDRATGVRPEKRRREETVVPNDNERCTKRACDCAAVRAEREELLLQRDELLLEAAAHRQLVLKKSSQTKEARRPQRKAKSKANRKAERKHKTKANEERGAECSRKP